MTITAKYAGRCQACGGAINVGDKIEWTRESGAQHIDCNGSPIKPAPQASPSRSHVASPKQIRYAASLVRKLRSDDYGTFTTFGLQNMDEAQITKMTRREVSNLIEQVRDEIY